MIQKYRQKQLDGSKKSLSSIVASQLIVMFILCSSIFSIPFDEKVTARYQGYASESAAPE